MRGPCKALYKDKETPCVLIVNCRRRIPCAPGYSFLVDFSQFKIDRVNEAENGQLAWDLFQKEPYDIVLTDINMPKLNGIQLAELIKEHAPQTHLVFNRL